MAINKIKIISKQPWRNLFRFGSKPNKTNEYFDTSKFIQISNKNYMYNLLLLTWDWGKDALKLGLGLLSSCMY